MGQKVASLEIDLSMTTGQAVGELNQFGGVVDKVTATALRELDRLDTATKTAGDMTAGTNSVVRFAQEVERSAATVRRENNRIEASGEGIVRSLEKRIQVYGLTSAQIRSMRAELAAASAEDRGMTELAGRLRAAAAEMNRLEGAGVGAAGGVRKTGGAMAALAPQAQDLFTQISVGGNALNAFAIQGGQAAGQMIYMEGAAGAVGRFMMGPWGIALTGAALLVGTLGGKLWDGAEAAKAKAKAAHDLTSAIDSLYESTLRQISGEDRLRQATIGSANALLTKAAATREALQADLRAKLATARVTLAGAQSDEPGSEAATFLYRGRLKEAIELQKQLGAAVEQEGKARAAVRAVQIVESDARITERLDKQAGATGRYTRELQKVRDAYVGNRITQSEYEAQALKLNETYKAETKALGDATRARGRHSTANHDAAIAHRAAEKAARDAAAAERELAQDLDNIVKRFDPARAAGEEYAATLAKIDKLVAAGKLSRGDAAIYGGAANDQEQARRAEERRKAFEKTFGAGDPLAAGIAAGVDAAAQRTVDRQEETNRALRDTVDLFDTIDQSAQRAAGGMADAFGRVGATIGNTLTVMTGYYAEQAKLQADHKAAIDAAGTDQKAMAREQQIYAIRSASAQVEAYGNMAGAAKHFFKEGSGGYSALAAAEKVYRVAQLAMSIAAMAQNAAETFGFVANSTAKATAAGAEGIANQSKLVFPYNIIAMAATGAALVAAGIAVLGGGHGGASALPASNTGAGTVLGDRSAQSESITRALDALHEVDTTTSVYARQMAGSLRSIEDQIGGVAAQIVRAGNVDASGGITEGFKTNGIGKVLGSIPLIGGFLSGLFGSTTTVLANGLTGGAQSIASILSNGFEAQYYSDIQKKSKFLGITTGTKVSTQYAGADPALEAQFTLLIRQFNDAIVSSAGPLGLAADQAQARINALTLSLGKIDLKGLTGEQIEEKLSAVFGAAADKMADAAYPGLQRFQKVGEGAFETLVRISSTVEAVTDALGALGASTAGLGIDAKLGLAGQFESIGAMRDAADAYFQSYYTAEEQRAAKEAQLGKVFASLNLAMPETIAGYRQLVDAQNLTTAAGQSTYATLLQLAPAFADLQGAMEGARSAADIASERQDLERRLLELRGDTAAIRALDLAKVDASNRALQQQVWAVEDAQAAAKAAEDLSKAWGSVGDSIVAEINRIRGLTATGATGSFAGIMAQFNGATAASRAGDQDAAKNLPQLSKALLDAAALQATSRQELDRVQAQTAASLEATNAVIAGFAANPAAPSTDQMAKIVAAAATAQVTPAGNGGTVVELRATLDDLRDELAAMRKDMNDGNIALVRETKRGSDALSSASDVTGGVGLGVVALAG